MATPPGAAPGAFHPGQLPSGLTHDIARALFEQSPFSTVVYDMAGHIVAANAAFERLFGLAPDAIPPEYSILDDPQLGALGLLPAVRRAFDGEVVALTPLHYDASTLHGGGRSNWTQAHLFPLRGADGGMAGVVLVHVDLTERVEAEEGRRREEQRLRIALEAGRLGAWEWDIGSGGAVHWSDMMQRIHGLEVGAFGGTFDEFQADIHPDDRERVLASVERSLAGHEHHLEYRIVRPDGEVRWLDSRGQVYHDAEGRPARMLGVVADVTARKLAEVEAATARERLEEQAMELEAQTEQLQQQATDLEAHYGAAVLAREEADHANRAKAEFLTTMSHELRTPLNAIGGYAQLIEMGVHGPVTQAQREALDRVQRSQQHLLSLINDVLNFAKLEAGRVTFDIATVALHEVLGGLEALVAPQLAAKRLRYVCETCDASLTLSADSEKLRQILLNLLSNAIKFTAEGGEVRVAADSDGEWVRVTVADTGAGIAAEKLELIFEPFVQLDRSRSSTSTGTGLGLSISRDLARAMGGDLTATSTPGAGSTFTLSLPRAPRP